jgi:hypothetical protein
VIISSIMLWLAYRSRTGASRAAEALPA